MMVGWATATLATALWLTIIHQSKQTSPEELWQRTNTTEAGQSYHDYSLFQVLAQNQDQMRNLMNLSQDDGDVMRPWIRHNSVGRPHSFVVRAQDADKVQQKWEKIGVKYNKTLPSLGKLIEYEDESRNSIGRKCGKFKGNSFNSFNEIEWQLKCFAKKYSSCSSLKVLGKSYEKRPIYMMVVNPSGRNKGVWIDGGIHAREWLSPAVAMMTLHNLLERCRDRRDVSVSRLKWFVAPLVNPDGYVFSRTRDRLWRKNTRPTQYHARNDQQTQYHFNPAKTIQGQINASKQMSENESGRLCHGVDLNRNFGYHWNDVNTENNPCTEDYHGQSPFSEPETRSIAAFLKNNVDTISGVLSLHSYGQLIIYPWDFTGRHRKMQDCVTDVAKRMSSAMQTVKKRVYRFGQTHDILYPASGTFTDWVVGSLGINLAYVLELPDEGDRGFLVSANEILPTFKEVWSALAVVQRAVLQGRCETKENSSNVSPKTPPLNLSRKYLQIENNYLEKRGEEDQLAQQEVSNRVEKVLDRAERKISQSKQSEMQYNVQLEDAVDQFLAPMARVKQYRQQDDPTIIEESVAKRDPSVHKIQIIARGPNHNPQVRNYTSKLGNHILICFNCTNLVEGKQKAGQNGNFQAAHQISEPRAILEDTKSKNLNSPSSNGASKSFQHEKPQKGGQKRVSKFKFSRREFSKQVIKRKQPQKQKGEHHMRNMGGLSSKRQKRPNVASSEKRYPLEQHKLHVKDPKKMHEKSGATQSSASKIVFGGPLKTRSVRGKEATSLSPTLHSIMTSGSPKHKSYQEPLKSHQSSIQVNRPKSSYNRVATSSLPKKYAGTQTDGRDPSALRLHGDKISPVSPPSSTQQRTRRRPLTRRQTLDEKKLRQDAVNLNTVDRHHQKKHKHVEIKRKKFGKGKALMAKSLRLHGNNTRYTKKHGKRKRNNQSKDHKESNKIGHLSQTKNMPSPQPTVAYKNSTKKYSMKKEIRIKTTKKKASSPLTPPIQHGRLKHHVASTGRRDHGRFQRKTRGKKQHNVGGKNLHNGRTGRKMRSTRGKQKHGKASQKLGAVPKKRSVEKQAIDRRSIGQIKGSRGKQRQLKHRNTRHKKIQQLQRKTDDNKNIREPSGKYIKQRVQKTRGKNGRHSIRDQGLGRRHRLRGKGFRRRHGIRNKRKWRCLRWKRVKEPRDTRQDKNEMGTQTSAKTGHQGPRLQSGVLGTGARINARTSGILRARQNKHLPHSNQRQTLNNIKRLHKKIPSDYVQMHANRNKK